MESHRENNYPHMSQPQNNNRKFPIKEFVVKCQDREIEAISVNIIINKKYIFGIFMTKLSIYIKSHKCI